MTLQWNNPLSKADDAETPIVMPVALTIAGSDSGGGAGVQADIKTFSALGVFGASAITAITAQNTRGVSAIENLSPAIVSAQIDAVLSDLQVGAIKIGMVSQAPIIEAIGAALQRWDQRAVLDPVMVATAGDRLLDPQAISALSSVLLPLASVVTPNLPEAALLAGEGVALNETDMERQAEKILRLGAAAVLIKGGHAAGRESTDIFFDGRRMSRLSLPRIETTNDHGTGCTLSAAIAAYLARGEDLASAVALAKDYLHGALAAGARLKIGKGRGPVHHFHAWHAEEAYPRSSGVAAETV